MIPEQRTGRGARRHVLRGCLAVLAALLVTGCGSTAPPAPSVVGVSPSAGPSAASPSPSTDVGPSPSAQVAASPSPGGSPAVPIDAGLLAILPATVGGQAISEIPEIEANLVTDPNLVQNAAALAVALGINGSSGDFAYIAVIQLKPIVFSNAFYLSWRQSYDEGACSQSSGLKSTSSTEIAGRQVFVGTCTGGATTYHVHLASPDRLVSITSVGAADFGRLVLAGLNP